MLGAFKIFKRKSIQLLFSLGNTPEEFHDQRMLDSESGFKTSLPIYCEIFSCWGEKYWSRLRRAHLIT